jgi:methionyl-tRNA formyltransferase
MRILFAGSPEIALPTLERLAAEHEVVAVLTNPDSVAGRGLAAARTPVAVTAERLGIPVLSFDHLGPEARAAVASYRPEILVSFAYVRLFGPKFLALFPRGGLNIHPSLLPLHRGASPIPAAILARDAETGVSVQALAADLDSGDLFGVTRIPLTGRETTESLTALAAAEGADLVSAVLKAMEEGRAVSRPQEGAASYSGIISKEAGLVDWGASVLDIDAKIRAYYPWPCAFTWFRGQRLSLLEALPYPGEAFPGSEAAVQGEILGLDKARGIMVKTLDGLLGLRRLQLQTKKALPYREFANGVHELAGAVLGNPAVQESGLRP